MAKGRKDSLYFTFGDNDSVEMGLRVRNFPNIPVAETRGKAVEIPGRDGDLWLADHSFKPVSIKIEFEVSQYGDFDAITAWLTGSGKLSLSVLEGYYWRARVVKGFDFASGIFVSGYYRTTVEFVCQPFRYESGDPAMEPITSAGLFNGKGTWTAKPIITVNGSGNVNLMVNGASVLMTGIDGYITLDCDAMMAYKGDTNLSPNVTIMSDDGAWPTLVPGSNMINWSVNAEDTGSTDAEVAASSVTSVVIQPNWRWR